MLQGLKVLAALLLVAAYMLAIIIVFFIVAFAILWLVDGDYSTKTDDDSCNSGGEENMKKNYLVQWHYNDGRYVNEHYSKSFNTIEEAVSKYEELRAEYTQHIKDNFAFDMLTVEENDAYFKISYKDIVDIIVISIERR